MTVFALRQIDARLRSPGIQLSYFLTDHKVIIWQFQIYEVYARMFGHKSVLYLRITKIRMVCVCVRVCVCACARACVCVCGELEDFYHPLSEPHYP